MKTNITTFLFLLFILRSFFSYSQIQITNKDYEVSDDVVKIEEVRFKETNDLTENEDYIDLYEFSKGHITGKVRIRENKIVDQVYYNNYNSNEFYYENYNKTFGDYKAQYQVITFNQLKFYYPKTDFVVIQDKPNILFEFSYSIQGRKITHKFEKLDSNFITHTYDDYGYHIDTYNTNGQKVKTETKSLTKSDLFYSSDGLLEHSETIYGKYIDRPHKTYYSYQKDKKGNWFKRVQISLDSDDTIKTAFTSRQITYANGEVSGSIYYDPAFVKWEVVVYSPDLKDDVSKKTIGCISGDCQNGFGIYIERDGKNTVKFIGNFKSGVISGYGKTYLNNQLTYDGQWYNEKYHGKGTLYTGGNNESRFVGTFKNGVMEGPCKMYKNEKLIFEGNYSNNSIEGKGTYYDYKTGKKIVRIYKNGNPIKIISSEPIKNKNNSLTSNNIPNGIVWKKNEENTEFWLYNNKIEITGNVFFLDNDLYVFLPNTKQIYVLENFNQQKANTYYFASLLPEKFPHGAYIRRNATGLIAVNAKGKIIKSNSVFKFAPGGGDIIYKGTNETKTLLFKNFTNAKINKVYPAELYQPNRVVKSNINSNKITWKKNEANSYWLYDNGALKSGGKSFWQGNNLYVYMVNDASLYLLKNYKTETPNTTHQAELLPNKFSNGLWYKTSKGGAMVYNAKGLFIKTTEIYKYNTNGIDVLFKGKDEKETLLLKNFKNVSTNVVFPAEVYNTSKVSASSLGNLKEKTNIDSYILNCKTEENEVTCLAQKLEEDVNKLQSQGKSQTEINNFLENKIKILANYNVDTLYNTIMSYKYNSKIAKLIMPLFKKLPQHQLNRIKELANKTMNDYSKKQNQYKKRN